MILTVASFKGGVGKTTTAVHLAAFLASKSTTILVDGDPNGSATLWAERGQLPFEVVGIHQAQKAARRCEHLVIDTGARPSGDEMKALADGCDLLVLPTSPDALAIDALMQTVTVLSHASVDYRILLTIVPPRPIPEGKTARQAFRKYGLPLFKSEIRRIVAFQRAAAAGVTVDKIPDELARLGAADYERVGDEIETIYAKTPVQSR